MRLARMRHSAPFIDTHPTGRTLTWAHLPWSREQEQRTGSKEQGAENREQRIGTKDLRAGSKNHGERREGSREQGPENTEQRTELREQIARNREHEAEIGEQTRGPRVHGAPPPLFYSHNLPCYCGW